ncbi:MAG: DUF447 domain-containing protein [Desulfurococcaceae archaeon TW002]
MISKFLRFGYHESIAVTLDEGSVPHAAPMGVEYSGSYLILKPYKSSKTYANLISRPLLSLNFTHDARYFFKAIFKREEIDYDFSVLEAPPVIIGDFDLYVWGRTKLLGLVNDRAVFLVAVEKVHEGPGSKLALSRANNALLEALIYYTKIVALGNEGSKELAEYLNLLRINLNLVRKLGNPELVEMAETIKDKLNELLGDVLI